MTGRRVVVCQTSMGDYRQAFLEETIAVLGPALEVWSGSEYFEASLQTRIRIGNSLHPLGNHFLVGRRLLWQSGAFGAARGADVAVLEYNPRILSTWAVLAWRKIRRRPSLLWGHSWSRSGPRSKSEPLRRFMRTLSDGLIVYSERQRDELTAVDPRRPVFVAPNSLYRQAAMQPPVPDGPRDSFVFVGRMAAAKRPDLLLEGFLLARPRLPPDTRLVMVGEGPLLGPMRARAAEAGALGVEFPGHVGDPGVLATIYGRAIAAVSPAAAGLSVTQAFGFGVPMLISRDEPHGPEIVAAREGWNAVFFAPATPDSLADALVRFVDLRGSLAGADDIAEYCRANFSVEAMALGFVHAVDAVTR